MWHGDKDTDVPLEAAEYLKAQIGPAVKDLAVLEGENHTLIRRHWLKILQGVVALAKSSSASL